MLGLCWRRWSSCRLQKSLGSSCCDCHGVPLYEPTQSSVSDDVFQLEQAACRRCCLGGHFVLSGDNPICFADVFDVLFQFLNSFWSMYWPDFSLGCDLACFGSLASERLCIFGFRDAAVFGYILFFAF